MDFRRYVALFSLLFCLSAFSFAQQNLTLLSHITYPPGITLAGVWQYVDTAGNEYALVGTYTGIDIYDVTIPSTPNLVVTVPGNTSTWREVKTWGHYAYVSTEGTDLNDSTRDGLQIINLAYLPDSAPAKIWKGDGAINNLLQRGHTVQTANGYVYINGSNLAGGGVIIADLNDPWNPHYVGQYSAQYVHDCYVRGNRLWACEVNPGQFSVVDISVPSSPVSLNTEQAFGIICHSGWLSDNSNYFYATVEVAHAPLAAYDVSDINNISVVDIYYTTDSASHEVHNVHVLNDFLVNACYGSQVTIVDAARPNNLIQVGNYFTGTSLCWDVTPYLPSGNILAADMNGGFYIFAPTYVRACYLEGIVKDSITSGPINNAHVQIMSTPILDSTNFLGNYATGLVQPGTYDVQYSATGYITQIITGVSLSNGVLTTLNVALLPIGFSTNDIYADNSISIFPNPTGKELRIKNAKLRIESIDIYDAFGKLVYSQKPKASSQPSAAIDLSTLENGIYFVRLKTDRGNSVTKFVKE